MLVHLNTFLDWFADGLGAVVPRRWRFASRWPRRWLLITTSADAYRCVLCENRQASGASFEIAHGASGEYAAKAIPAEVTKLVRKHQLPVVLRLPSAEVLQKTLHLPATAEAELERIVGFEIDRQTPFRAQDVYAGFAVDTKRSTAERLAVTLAVIRRPALKTRLEHLMSVGLEVTVVDVEGSPAPATGMNMLRHESQAQSASPAVLRALLVCALLLAIAMVPLLETRRIEAEIVRLNDIGRQQRDAVAAVRALREQTREVAHGSAFLRQRETRHVRTVEVLHEASELLPDHSWVHRLEIKNGELNLQGESGEAAALPGLLEASPLFADPRFSAPLTRNATATAERFKLTTSIVAGNSG